MKIGARRRRCAVWVLALALLACEKEKKETPASTTTTPGVPPPELAKRVLAKVGNRTITLGDYAEALARMDRFEQLRYQTKERRKQLLDEMIQVELLAREAERRGLADQPETQLEIHHLYREEVLRGLREAQPSLEELPNSEVKAYYDAHPDEFSDPERRRVAVIAVRSAARAKEIAAQAREADAQAWGRLVRRYSERRTERSRGGPDVARPPLELAGDLGLVSATGKTRGANPAVPEVVRRAVFRLERPGEIAAEPVGEAGWHYIVRLVNVTPARTRSFAEAESTIRARLLRERILAAERELVRKLREEVPVQINEAALVQLQRAVAEDQGSVERRNEQEGSAKP